MLHVPLTKASKNDLRRRMKEAGLSYRRAAKLVRVNYRYLFDILHDRRAHSGIAVCERLEVVIQNSPKGGKHRGPAASGENPNQQPGRA